MVSITDEDILELAKKSGINEPEEFSEESLKIFARTIESLVEMNYRKKIADLENIICTRYLNSLK